MILVMGMAGDSIPEDSNIPSRITERRTILNERNLERMMDAFLAQVEGQVSCEHFYHNTGSLIYSLKLNQIYI